MDAAAAPLVSVVVPTYNRFDTTCRAVDSVLAQTLTELEVIVVDDTSTDGSPGQLLARYRDEPRVRVASTGRNSGGGTARNLGAEQARAPYIAFLDSDDVWAPDKLAVQLELHRREAARSPAPLLVYAASTVEYPPPGGHIRPDRPLRPGERVEEYIFCDEQDIQTSGWFLSTADFARVRFTDGLRRHQDLDLCIRAQALGFRFVMSEQPLYARLHGADMVHVGKIRDDGVSSAWIERMKPLVTRRAYHHFRLFCILPALQDLNAPLCRRLCVDALCDGRFIALARIGWQQLKHQTRPRRQHVKRRLKRLFTGA
jgi:glycosyltransferase involved in cell wall biosynthesis